MISSIKMTSSCRNCESQYGPLYNMLTTEFTHNGNQVNFSQCYSFCTGILQFDAAIQLICEMCKLQLQNLYTMKYQFLPQLQPTRSATPTTEEEIKEEVIEDINDMHSELVFVNGIKVEESFAMTTEEIKVEHQRCVNEENKADMLKTIGDISPSRKSRNLPNSQIAMLRETDEFLFQCQICLKNYASKKSLWGHKHIKHEDSPASEVFKTEIYLDRKAPKVKTGPIAEVDKYREIMYRDMHFTDRFECKYCLNSYQLAWSMISHATAKHKGEKPKGPTVFEKYLEERKTNGTPVYKCNRCGESFSDFHLFKGHVFVAHKNEVEKKHTIVATSSKKLLYRDPHNKDMFECKYCPLNYPVRWSLKRHVQKRHIEEEKQIKTIFDEHLETQNADTDNVVHFKCIKCPLIFDNWRDFKLHVYSKHKVLDPKGASEANVEPLNYISCEYCSANFTSHGTYLNHRFWSHKEFDIKEESEQTTYVCPICPKKSFTVKKSYITHMKSIHPAPTPTKGEGTQETNTKEAESVQNRAVLCSYCGASFTLKSSLLRHMKSYHEKKIHECLSCNKTFETNAKLRCHFKDKHGVKQTNETTNITCTKCDEKFTKTTVYYIHLKVMHHSKPPVYECNTCDRQFSSAGGLSQHKKKVHLKIRKVCETCEREFTTHKGLSEHLWEHRGFMPYVCPDLNCNFKTAVKQQFQMHLKKHKITYDEKLHGFRESDAEQIKQLQQSKPNSLGFGQKDCSLQYKCNLCPISFKWKQNLQRHMEKIHNPERFECKLCQKVYKQKEYLWSHCFEHRDFMPYNCKELECEYKTRITQTFKTHLWTVHHIRYDEEVHGYKKESIKDVLAMVWKQ